MEDLHAWGLQEAPENQVIFSFTQMHRHGTHRQNTCQNQTQSRRRVKQQFSRRHGAEHKVRLTCDGAPGLALPESVTRKKPEGMGSGEGASNIW